MKSSQAGTAQNADTRKGTEVRVAKGGRMWGLLHEVDVSSHTLCWECFSCAVYFLFFYLFSLFAIEGS